MRSWGFTAGDWSAPIGLGLAGCGGRRSRRRRLRRRRSRPDRVARHRHRDRRRDVSQELKGSGLHFVARYYRDPASRWPTLSAEEARTVIGDRHEAGGGLAIAFATSRSISPTTRAMPTRSPAHQQAKAIGQPAGSAIYFAVDYNAPEPDISGAIDQYFRGVAAGLAAAAGRRAEYRVGVYGSGAVCALPEARAPGRIRLAVDTRGVVRLCAASPTGTSSRARDRRCCPSTTTSTRRSGEYGGFTVQDRQASIAIAGS